MQDILCIVRSVFSFISIRSQALATPGMDIPPASLPSSLSVSPHFSRPDHFRKRQKPAPGARSDVVPPASKMIPQSSCHAYTIPKLTPKIKP
jgi:hypothetical protein